MAKPRTAEGTFPTTGRFWRGSTLTEIDLGLMKSKAQTDKGRRAACERRLDMLKDGWGPILEGRIDAIFEPANAAEIRKVVDISNNPFKRIIADISTIYDELPQWTFEGEGDNEAWTQALESGMADVVLPKLNRLVNACNEALLYISPTRDGVKLHAVPAHDVIVWEDPADPTQPITIAVRQGFVNTVTAKPVWHVWSREEDRAEYIQLDGDPFETSTRVLERMPNPYVDEDGRPVLPAVLYHRQWPDEGLWDQTTGEDLYEATILIGLLETWINHLIRTDSIRQKYATGQLDFESGVSGGTMSMLTFRSTDGTPVNIGEFSSQMDWGGLGNTISRKLQNVLNNYGMSMADFELSGDPTSGFALRVRKEGLVEIRKRQIPVYRRWDLQAYDAISAVWNFERDNSESPIRESVRRDMADMPWASQAKPSVEYSEFQTTLTVQERQQQLELDKERIEMGLESVLSVYMRENPGLTEDEAREAIAKNKEDSKGLGVKKPEMTQPPANNLATILADRVRAKQAEQEEPEDETDDGAEG